MPILFRYIFRSLFVPFIVILLTMSGIVWLTQSMRILDLIVDKGIELRDFFYIASLLLPSLFYIITPIALTMTIAAVINRLRHDREVIVLKSIGLTDIQILRPFLYFAILVSLFNYFISLYAMPRCYREFKELSMHFRNNYASMLLQEDVFSTQIGNLTIYIGRFAEGGQLDDIFINDRRNPEVDKTITARSGSLKTLQNSGHLELMHGTIQEKNNISGKIAIVHFDHYKMIMDMSLTNINQLRGRGENEQYLHELLFPANMPADEVWRSRVHGHQRLIWPAFNISLSMFVAIWLLAQPYNRRQRAAGGIFPSIIVAAFIILAMLFYSAAKNNIYFLPLMYFNLALSFIAAMPKIFKWRGYEKKIFS